MSFGAWLIFTPRLSATIPIPTIRKTPDPIKMAFELRVIFYEVSETAKRALLLIGSL